MTAEELFDYWDKNVGPHIFEGSPGSRKTWQTPKPMPEDALAFLRGEDRPWPAWLCLYYPQHYPEPVVNELEGENRDLAFRMLTAYDHLCEAPMLCDSETDVRACKALGKDFGDMIKEQAGKEGIDSHWGFGIGTAKYYAAEAEDLVRQKLPRLSAEGNKKQFYKSVLYMTAGLILAGGKDREFYVKKIEDFISGFFRQGNKLKPLDAQDHDARSCLWHFLFHYHEISEKLRALFKDLLLEGHICVFVGRELDAGGLETLAEKLKLPSWFYPMMVANQTGQAPLGLAPAAYLEKILQENSELFVETFRAFLAFPDISKSYFACKLLGLMARRPVDKAEFERLLPELTDRIMGDLPAAPLPPRPWQDPVIQACAGLYEYAPPLTDYFNRAFQREVENHAKDCQAYPAELVYAFFKGRREEWFDRDPGESAGVLLANKALAPKDLFRAYAELSANYGDDILPGAVISALVREYPAEGEAFFQYLKNSGSTTSIESFLRWLDAAYNETTLSASPLPDLLSHYSKQVIKKAERLLLDREEEIRPSLEALMPKLKGNGALAARRLIKSWDTQRQFGKGFTFRDKKNLRDYCELNFDKESQRRIQWIPPELYSHVRYADLSETAAPEVMGSLLSEYLFLEEPARLPLCDKIAAGLCKADLEESLKAIYQHWLAGNADTKKKMIMLPCCIYAPDSFLLDMKKQIEVWTKNARGALASFVVFCTALNGGSTALLIVDGYTNKAPNNQVKNSAREAFALAARELGISLDELSDRIVPDFGFDQRGEKTLDYGGRLFRLSLESGHSISIYDVAADKFIKTLPAPGAKDDKAKAEAAKKEFTELKKTLKAAVQNQTLRLEKIFGNGRKWTPRAWTSLFVENPVMRRFAMGLVWGIYTPLPAVSGESPPGAEFRTAFRYMEDGSFNTVDEEEYHILDDVLITLAHPTEMGETLTAAWKQQLEDYEIDQPFPQLASAIKKLDPSDMEENIIIRYRGKITTAGKLLGLSKKFDLRRGEVMDAGSYIYFTLEEDYLKAGAAISFDSMYMGIDAWEQVTLENLVFYRLGGELPVEWRGEIKPEKALNPLSLPPRYVSGIIGIMDQLISGGNAP